MRYCEACDKEFTNPTCPRCGARPTSRHQDRPDPEVPRISTFVSDPDDRLDAMIEKASRPTLAQLVKRGVKAGLIQVMPEYGSKKRA